MVINDSERSFASTWNRRKGASSNGRERHTTITSRTSKNSLEHVYGKTELLSPNYRIVIQNNMCYRFGIMGNNEKTISFRAVTEKIDALDSLAAAQDRSRSYLINEAITNYIEMHAYQDALVQKGLEEMRKGRVVSHEEIVKRLKKTGRARQSPSQ